MYQNAPFSSYKEAVSKLRGKKINLLIFKNKRAVVMDAAYVQSKAVGYLFFLQILLPLAFIVPYTVYTGHYLGLLAALPYLILPFVRPLRFFLSMVLTALGVFGLALHWHGALVCLLLPAQLAWWGEQSWWNAVQYCLLKRLLQDKALFDEMWRSGVIGFHDKTKTYTFSPCGA